MVSRKRPRRGCVRIPSFGPLAAQTFLKSFTSGRFRAVIKIDSIRASNGGLIMPAVAFVFHGPTNYPATKFLRNAMCGWASGRPVQDGTTYTEMYLLLSSEGGSVEEAFSLYNLIRALPGRLGSFSRSCLVSSAGLRNSLSLISTFLAMIVSMRPRTRFDVSRFSIQIGSSS
jgi:hypothetical protein